jgi:Protein of unknown function (DUF3106)
MKKSSLRFFGPVLLGAAALAASPVSLTDETENYRQLQAMPRERRVVLLENLERFDKLGPAEQEKIRKLNAQIASINPDEQPKYRSLMRRYQLWVSGLTEEQKETLRGTDDPEARFKLAIEYRKKELQAGSSAQRILGIRSGYFGLMPPIETANLLRVWNKLTQAQRAEVERQALKGHLESEIRSLANVVGVQFHHLPNIEEKKYDAILDGNEEFKKQLGHFAKRVEVKKNDAAKAKGEHPQTRFEFHFTEFRYFEDHKPKPVLQTNLEKFSAWCPAWFHSMIDPLSADDARNYLTLVYRQIFPEPSEITAEWKPAKEKSAAIPGAPRPTPKRSGPQPPL